MPRYSLPLIIIIALLFSCQDKKVKKNKKVREVPEYSIGVNLPLTGNASYFAEEFRKGMDLAFDHYRDSAAKIKLNILYEDNKFSPRDAITITRKFINVDDVDLVMVGYTPIIQATANVLEEAGIEVTSAEVGMIPQSTVKIEGSNATSLLKLMELLDDHDDVQTVNSNFDIDEDILNSAE